MTSNRWRRCTLLCVLVAGAVSACRDAPTGPYALHQLAGGEEWVAVFVPEQVPTLETWLPYLVPVTAEHRAALERVRSLRAEAEGERRAGRLGRAQSLSREAVRAAVVSLTRHPEPHVLREALYGVDIWAERVRRDEDLDRFPHLRAAVETVEDEHGRATELLAAGDTTSAVLYLASASETIREHAPSTVALRVLSRVEDRLRAEEDGGVDHSRALHLLSSARQELLSGDPGRALQRALYALQLADGRGMHPERAEEAPALCRAPPCDPS